jgi:hypothetical protein
VGTLTYDSKLVANFDDRVLAHLQVVIWAKLRRGEQFSFTFIDTQRNGLGRTSIWISSWISLTFDYYGSKMPTLNTHWIDALTKAANSPGGLQVLPEPTVKPPES